MNKIQKILLCAFMAINSNVHSAQEDYKKIPIEIQSEVILGQQGIRLNPERNTSTQINRFDLSLGFAFYFKEDGKDLFRLIEETQKWSDGQHARKRFRQAENLLKKFIWHGYEFLEGSRINTCISARFRAGWLGIQGNTYLDDGKGASSFDWPTTNLEFYKVNSVAGPILTIENKEIHLGLLVKMWDFLFVSLNINPKICNVWDYNLLGVITTPAPNSIGKRLELINKNIKCNVQYFKIVTGRATKECKDEFAFVKESCRKNGFVDGLVYAWLFFHQVVRVDVKINALRSLRSINSLSQLFCTKSPSIMHAAMESIDSLRLLICLLASLEVYFSFMKCTVQNGWRAFIHFARSRIKSPHVGGRFNRSSGQPITI